MLDLLARLFSGIVRWALRRDHARRLRKYPGISSRAAICVGSVLMGPRDNFQIGDLSYINQAHLSCGPNSKVIIGRGCAIGYNVSIKAITHSLDHPTNNEFGLIVHREQDIVIGDDCWVGDNVFIKEGVVLGNRVIVGANSVVTRAFPDDVIIAGVPARIIKKR